MKQLTRRLIAGLLVLLCMGSLSVFSLADNYRYPADQYFEESNSYTWGFGVQVSATKDLNGAVMRRNSMLEMGYDAYIYHSGNYYCIFCGKFTSTEEASHYQDYICSHTDRKSAYVNNVNLPSWAFEEFQQIYRTDPFNTQGQDYGVWENPSGPYVDANNATSTRTVYTVQFSSGTNFTKQEQNRDALIAQGFSAYVYKIGGKYKGLCGMYDSYGDAEACCNAIKAYTSETDAYVTTVEIPTSYVITDKPINLSYYDKYLQLLYNYTWAYDYLPSGIASNLIYSANEGDQMWYCYYVYDLDDNGVDELIILDCRAEYDGAWAIFSYSSGKPYLVAWGYPYGVPELRVCMGKKLLAMQSYYAGMGVTDLLSFSNGKLVSTKRGTSYDWNYVSIEPTDVDPEAGGYYVKLTPYHALTDFSRLTDSSGGGTVSAPSSGGYTSAGILSAARNAAAYDSHYSTVSDYGVDLMVPDDSSLLRTPFQMRTYAERGIAIYIMPRPEPNNGTLGTVKHQELVTVVAENDYYYFFVTEDGRAGWNGKGRFTQP